MKVLITGASSGIGKEMTKILAQKYDELVLVAKDYEKLKKLKQELENFTNVKIVALDLSKKENCLKLYNENKDIDLLINNAGFGDTDWFYKTDLDKDLMMINTNIVAYHILTKLYLKDMIKKDKGQILNVASMAGFSPGPLMATYYATKAYIVSLSESIKEELNQKKSHVKISILCPGPVATNFEKVANVEFKMKEMSSSEVASYALNNLDKFYIVPGIKFKVGKFLAHVLPSSLTAKVIYRIQKKRV